MPFCDMEISMTSISRGLLYLTPREASVLVSQLRKLFVFISRSKHSEVTFFRIRKKLSDLTLSLSPLSKSKRLINEILELTEHTSGADQTKLMALMSEIQDIYPLQPENEIAYLEPIGGH